jgi:hypothetical protein
MSGRGFAMTAMGPRHSVEGGFSLTEMLLGLAIGLTVTAAVMHGLIRASRGGEQWGVQLQERQLSRRTLALMRSELDMARTWMHGPGSETGAECALGGRLAVLRIEAGGRPITYSIGEPPSPIWRGWVLMRCGPAYGLSGELSGGSAQNRVVIDGLPPDADGLQVSADLPKVVQIELKRQLAWRSGMSLIIRERILVGAPGV